MPNDNYANEPNQSRSEDIIQSILDNTEYDEEAGSRIEYLLIELKNAIEGGGGGGGVTSYAPLTEKPKIDNHTLQAGNNTSSDLGLQTKLTFDSAPTENSTNPVTSGGVYTALDSKANSVDVYNKSAVDTALEAKADKSTTYTKSDVDTALSSKQNTISDLPTIRSGAALGATAVQPVSGKDLSTNDYTTTEKTKLAGIADGAEVNKIEGIKVNNTTINPDANKTVNITVPTSAADVSALPASTKYAAALSLTINSSTYVMTGQLKDQNGDNLGTAQTIDLPLESVVVGGSYNSQTKKVVLTLQNGNTVEFSVADLVSGLQTELSANNKLNPAYINYDSTHRAVSDTEKSTWNGKQDALSSTQLSAVNSGITSTDVEQITNNKNNILSNTLNGGGINKFQVTATTTTINGITFTVNSDKTITATGSIADSSKNAIFTMGEYTAVSGDVLSEGLAEANSKAYIYARGGSTSLTQLTHIAIHSNDIGVRREYACAITGTTVGQVNITFKPMICNSDSYAKSGVYQPFALSNVELTAKEQVNESNISFAVEKTGNNLVNLPSGSGVRWIDVTVNIPPGVYTFGFSNLSGNDSRPSQVSFYSADSSFYISIDKGNDVYINNVTFTNTVTAIRVYASTNSTTSLNQGVNFTTLFLCKQETWNPSVGIQPYAMSNAELTAKEQTNENNISSVQEQANWNTNNCVKNISPYNNGTTSTGEGTVWNNLPIDIPAGTYSVSFLTDSTNSAFVLLAADGTTEVLRKTYSATNVSDTFTISTAAKFIRLYIGSSKTVSNFMIHSFGDNTFVPYAMSNAELTAKEQTNENNISTIVDWLNSLNRNLSPVYGGISEANKFIVNDTAVSLPAGTYTISWVSAAKTGSTVVSVFNGGTRIINQSINNATNDSYQFTLATACDKFNLYTSVANTISNLQIVATS